MNGSSESPGSGIGGVVPSMTGRGDLRGTEIDAGLGDVSPVAPVLSASTNSSR